MPNPTSNSVNSVNAPDWSIRNTRIAVELLIDGVSNWYPVDLVEMACNVHYVINSLTVMGPGSQGPDYPVVREDVNFTLFVMPWSDESVKADFYLE